MCIVKSVGQSARNDLTDVMVFQILFNLNIGRFPDPKPAKLESRWEDRAQHHQRH